MVIAIGKGGQADVADQFKNLNAGAVDISYDGGTDFGGGGSSDDSDSDMAMMAPGGGGGFGGGFGGAPSGDMGGGSLSGGEAPGGSPGGEMPSGDGGGMPDMGSFFGGQSDICLLYTSGNCRPGQCTQNSGHLWYGNRQAARGAQTIGQTYHRKN